MTRQSQQRRSGLLLGAVLSALPIIGFTAAARGQYRVGDDGRVNDANNRLGSGGYNSSHDATQRPAASFGNQIVTGNSTGLSYFHGGVSYSDPMEFRGNTGTNASDHFLSVSAPIDYGQRTTGASQYQPYYSKSQLAAPLPSGSFSQTEGGQGYVPSPPITNQPNDTRLGIINSAEVDNTQLPTNGSSGWAGPVDPSASSVAASPLLGVRELSDDPLGAAYLSRTTSVRPESPGDRTRLDNASVMQLRAELNNTMVGADGQPLPNNNGGQPGTPGNPSQNSGAIDLSKSQQIGGPTATAGGPTNSLSPQALNSTVANPALSDSVTSNQGVVQRMLIPPAEQSAQYAELERRYQQSKGQMTDQQANELYNRQVDVINNPKPTEQTASAQSQASKTAIPPAGNQPPPPVTDYAKANQDILTKAQQPPLTPMVQGPLTDHGQPMVITSLATGIKAHGLAELMKTAEAQMRQGKFTAALDTYDTAQQVAPNNPLIPLGRGFAELGASYYGKAEGDIRRAIAIAPPVLVGQYDLKGFLGEDRLKFVVKDLKDILTTEKSQRPALLLAYIFHNVGDNESTVKYLDEAERRSGGQDAQISQMRNTWNLKKGDAIPQ